MSLSPGQRLGAYEILGPIGAGGMGEVYRARDARLGRDVAVKVLPEAVANDPARRERFEREARAVAALSHPNILAIHDFGTQDDAAYAVMELLEGETLRQRLAAGALPARKAVELGVQIASGLGAAHEKGIVHRDLKPENVFVTRDGRVKILDFGLAAYRTPEAAEPTSSPTLSRYTDPGVVLGTAGYMAPEQVRGANVDHRADVFSLGAILYEMLAGQRAFQRETAAETMTAILKEDVPEVSGTGRHIPPALERLVRRCLEKNPEERLQSARDLAIALEAVSGSEASAVAPAVVTSPRRVGLPLAGLGLLLLGVALGAVGTRLLGGTGRQAAVTDFKQLTFNRGWIPAARFAPDGQTIAYSAIWDSAPSRLYTVRLERPRAAGAPLADGQLLALSRSGELALLTQPTLVDLFRSHGTLAQLPLAGGAPRELVQDVLEADWSPDGQAAVLRSEAGRSRLEFPIGTVRYETPSWLSGLRFSPAGDRIAFHEHPIPGDDRGWPVVIELASGARRNLTPEHDTLSGLAWSPDGREVCYASGSALECAGVVKPGVRNVLRGAPRLFLYDVASDGRVLFSIWMARGALVGGETAGREVDLSWQDMSLPADMTRDGSLLFESLDYGVYLRSLKGGTPVRLGEGISAALSPDGQWALSIVPGVPTQLGLLPTGAGASRLLKRGTLVSHAWAVFMPDGRGIVISGNEPGHGSRLWAQDLSGGDPRPITAEGVHLMPFMAHAVSPDAKWIVALGPDQHAALYPVEGGEARPIPGLGGDLPVGWTDNPHTLFVRPPGLSRTWLVSRLDVMTGRREPWRELGPADPIGAPLMASVIVSPDGARYVYPFFRSQCDLFLATGLFGAERVVSRQ